MVAPHLNRQVLAAGLLATLPLPAVALAKPIEAGPTQAGPRTGTVEASRDGEERLPDHAGLWSRLPLPFTPREAWHLLSAETQAEIGGAVIGMALADYVSGNGHAEADQFLDDGLRGAACDVACSLLGGLHRRIDVLLPDLFGPAGDHPSWALDGGLAR